jgi:hypothetical protein
MADWKLQARIARRAARRAAAFLRYPRALHKAPVLFANAFPKSGTHLLTQVLEGLARFGPAVNSGLPAVVMFDGDSGVPRPLGAVAADLARLRPGDIAYGHLHAVPEALQALCRSGAAPYFIYRDPRDVVVSHVHYVTDIETEHVHHHHYKHELQTFDERLRTSILGRPDLHVPFPDIRARFSPFLNWLDQPEVCVLRFEDFIQDQAAVLQRVLQHALGRGFPLAIGLDEAVRMLAAGLDPRRSPTFRSGKVGGWQARFTEGHKALFKETAGDLLIQLGYEQNHDW